MTLVGDRSSIAEARAENEYAVIFYSSGLTAWAFVYLAAAFVATEFHGVGQSTFVATARRSRVLANKLVLLGSGGLIVGVAASVMTVAATQGVLALRGFPPLDLPWPLALACVIAWVTTLGGIAMWRLSRMDVR